MLLTRQQFDTYFLDHRLQIAFIGMSNIGKSIRSRQLAKQKGAFRLSIDEKIAAHFSDLSEIEMAALLGMPFEEKFLEQQKKFLHLEEEETAKSPINTGRNIFLDTTGSVIYLSEKTRDFVKKNFLVIALDAAESMMEEMIREFFQTPKPLIWGNAFSQNFKETEREALRRCYPLLLQYRIERYRDMADVIIPGEISRNEMISTDRFWEILRLSLS